MTSRCVQDCDVQKLDLNNQLSYMVFIDNNSDNQFTIDSNLLILWFYIEKTADHSLSLWGYFQRFYQGTKACVFHCKVDNLQVFFVATKTRFYSSPSLTLATKTGILS